MGQPGRSNVLSSRDEFIVSEKRTGGSEPSQYPQEKKAIAIPSVAASESGTAQTEKVYKPASIAFSGLRGVARTDCGRSEELQTANLVEGSGKVRHRG